MAASRGRSGSHLILQMLSVPLSSRGVNSGSSGSGWMMTSPRPSKSLVVSGGRSCNISRSCSLGSTRISSEILSMSGKGAIAYCCLTVRLPAAAGSGELGEALVNLPTWQDSEGPSC